MPDTVRLLVVGESEKARRSLVHAVRSGGLPAEAEEAPTVESALAAIRRSEFDCALVDHRLPDGDSLALLRNLEARGRTDLPVVVVADHADGAASVSALQCGAEDFVAGARIGGRTLARSILHAIERRRARAKTGESQRVFQSALDALSACVAVLDETGMIVAVNEAWRRFADPGYPFGEAWTVGRDYLAAFMTPGDRAKEAGALATAVLKVLTRETDGTRLEYEWSDLAGSRWFLARVARCDGPGAARVVVAHEDCTLRKQTEGELCRRVEEVAVLNHRLAARKAELATYHELLTHDVSNFAMAVFAVAERLLQKADGSLTVKQEDLLRRAHRQAMDVNRLAENARLLAGLREKGLPLAPEPVPLTEAVRNAVQTVFTLHFDRPVSVSTECPDDLAVSGVPFLSNVLVNLIDNAVRHTPKETDATLDIRAAAEDETVRIAIRGGVPPSEEVFSHLFERYVRGHGSRGTGLGLALVREIVERAGGRVKAQAVQGEKGPLFEVILSLPRAHAPVVAQAS